MEDAVCNDNRIDRMVDQPVDALQTQMTLEEQIGQTADRPVKA